MSTNTIDQNDEVELSYREERRIRAWELKQEGWSQRKIAQELGVTEGAVSQWMKRVAEKGPASLKSQRRGQRQSLSHSQLVLLGDCLEFGAMAFGHNDDHWTSERFWKLLEDKFEVDRSKIGA